MTSTQVITAVTVPNWLAVLVVLGIGGLVVAVVSLRQEVRRTRAHSDAVLDAAAGDAEALRQELDALEQQLQKQAELVSVNNVPEITVVDKHEYVITEMGGQRRLPAVPTVPTPVFVDIVLRESLMRTASLAAGIRRALAPEVRNKIRFEMKREVKRSRKERKLLLRQARREIQARQRAELR